MADPHAPNTSVRSWAQLVRQADPKYTQESLRPVAYEFSNGRKFRQKTDPYKTAPGDSHSPGYPGTP
jgi:hypothetical protein